MTGCASCKDTLFISTFSDARRLHLTATMLLLVPLLLVPGCLEAAQCGVPGLPPGSRLVTSRGGEAVYRCREGWVGAAATRTCTEEGVWSRHTIHCGENRSHTVL